MLTSPYLLRCLFPRNNQFISPRNWTTNSKSLASVHSHFNFLAPTPHPRNILHLLRIIGIASLTTCRLPSALGNQPRSASPPAHICLNHMGKQPSFLASTIPPASLHFSERSLYVSEWTRDHHLRVSSQPRGSKKSKPFIRGSWPLWPTPQKVYA